MMVHPAHAVKKISAELPRISVEQPGTSMHQCPHMKCYVETAQAIMTSQQAILARLYAARLARGQKMLTTMPPADWILLGLACPTRGTILVALNCTLSADAPCHCRCHWQRRRAIVRVIYSKKCLQSSFLSAVLPADVRLLCRRRTEDSRSQEERRTSGSVEHRKQTAKPSRRARSGAGGGDPGGPPKEEGTPPSSRISSHSCTSASNSKIAARSACMP